MSSIFLHRLLASFFFLSCSLRFLLAQGILVFITLKFYQKNELGIYGMNYVYNCGQSTPYSLIYSFGTALSSRLGYNSNWDLLFETSIVCTCNILYKRGKTANKQQKTWLGDNFVSLDYLLPPPLPSPNYCLEHYPLSLVQLIKKKKRELFRGIHSPLRK